MERSRVSPAAFPEEDDEEQADVAHKEDDAMTSCRCRCWNFLRSHRGITDVGSGVSKDIGPSKPVMSSARVTSMLLVFMVSNEGVWISSVVWLVYTRTLIALHCSREAAVP